MHKHLRLFLLLAGFYMLIMSCTKNDVREQPFETPVVKVANEWLTSRIKEGETVRNERIESLRQSILPAKASTEILEDGEKLIIVPIANGFKMNTNSDKNADHYLLLFENKNKEVYKGNIVQFVPENSQQRSLPKNTLSRLWNAEDVNVNGTFTVLTIFDKHLYASTFKEGKRTKYAKLEKGSNDDNSVVSNDRAATDGDNCVIWYLETTTYYTDGTSETSKEYLGMSCNPLECVPGEQCSVLNPGDGGGGPPPTDPDEEVDRAEIVDWLVYQDPDQPSWKVWSRQKFKGKLRGDKGYFYDIVDKYTFAPNPAVNIRVWTPASVISKILNNGKNATVQVTGTVTIGMMVNKPVDTTASFTFTQVFN